MRGKLIVIEGTECSGKATQSNLLIETLSKEGIEITKFCFPDYDSPTGRIVGGPYLGKSYICESWFKEGASDVDPKVASLYYAADRRYNIDKIEEQLNNGVNVILGRYIYSNMAYQAGKIADEEERNQMYKWLEKLEFDLLDLPHADTKIFLHMSYESALMLKETREEELDDKEKESLIKAETAYKEIATKYDFYTIECENENGIRTRQDISDELCGYVIRQLNK